MPRRVSESKVGRQDLGIAGGYGKGHSCLVKMSSAVVTEGQRASASRLTFLECAAVGTWGIQASM